MPRQHERNMQHTERKSDRYMDFRDRDHVKTRTVLGGTPGRVGEPLAVILHHEEGARGRVQTHHVHALVHVLLKASGWGSRAITRVSVCV